MASEPIKYIKAGTIVRFEVKGIVHPDNKALYEFLIKSLKQIVK